MASSGNRFTKYDFCTDILNFPLISAGHSVIYNGIGYRNMIGIFYYIIHDVYSYRSGYWYQSPNIYFRTFFYKTVFMSLQRFTV
jgi:hypothetical protein